MSNVQLIVSVKLCPTATQKVLINNTLKTYISTVNDILTDMIDYDQHYCFSSSMINTELPSCLKSQCARDAKSIDAKMFKYHICQPVLKKPYAIWNNQSYRITENSISFPVIIDGKSKRITVDAIIPKDTLVLLSGVKLGTLRIVVKNKTKYIAQIAYKQEVSVCYETGVMGVDLGIKCPAVCKTDAGKVKFFGNGRKNKYIRRKFDAKRKKLGKAKKSKAKKNINNKENRIMNDIDHKLSRQIVNFAIDNKIKTIKLESLEGIHSSTRKSRKNNHSLHNWSFYRLQQYIKYKAELVGIEVQEVNPAYTSQVCPVCGTRNKAKDRTYSCKCGYHCHRDLVGATNILLSA